MAEHAYASMLAAVADLVKAATCTENARVAGEVQRALRVISVEVDALTEQASNEHEIGRVGCRPPVGKGHARRTFLCQVLQSADKLLVITRPGRTGLRVHRAVGDADKVGVALPNAEDVA